MMYAPESEYIDYCTLIKQNLIFFNLPLSAVLFHENYIFSNFKVQWSNVFYFLNSIKYINK